MSSPLLSHTDMHEAGDELRPSKTDIQRIYAQSSQRWSSHARKSHPQSGFSLESLRLRNMLANVPSYLGHNLVPIQEQSKKTEFDLHMKALPNGLSNLYVNGESLWNVGEGDCDLKEKTITHQILLGVQNSTSCSFSEDGAFADWSEVREHGKPDSRSGNCLAILVFAWSYILSAHWVEMQQASEKITEQSNDRVVYLCCQAGWRDETSESLPDTVDIHLGDVSNDAARWWAAVLAKEEGWRAEIERNRGVYRSPWSTTSISADHQFRLDRANTSQILFDSVSLPPCSAVSLGYLIDFGLLHGAGSQCSAALAAALTFPSLTDVSLPLPSSHDCYGQTQMVRNFLLSESPSPCGSSGEKDEILQDYGLLPYYMTLSCSSRGIESLLCNTFFDPHIPCNLVSAWIQPIFEVLDPLIARKEYAILAMVLGRQQPKSAGLWAGALITGMARSILQHCRNGFIAIEPHSAAWTGTTQTFMTLEPQPLPNSDSIYRTDECRLLYLAGEKLNSRLPVCPWRPFGTTALSDTDICVRTHANCKAGHYLRYSSWYWGLRDGQDIQDLGFCSNTPGQRGYNTTDDPIILDSHMETRPVSETISEMATRMMFGWLRSYGWPAAEKAIYSHSWMSEGSDDETDSGSELEGRDPGKAQYTGEKRERITAWRDQCAKESEGAQTSIQS
ncbi:hypothetical protein PVAG01_08756 [Phlyctema vagabunda]|uniref:Uncharacterized protein n=1 Tax=Phlyctema vagabunda TaxID=108571 RepID=A0ABR4PAC0_9HELO